MAPATPTRRLIEVVGSLNIDLITTTARVPGPGETLAANGFSTGFGGKGANQAVAAARLSRPAPAKQHPVRMIGAVGSDQFGRDFARQLDAEGIDRSGVATLDGQVTGTAVIIVEEQTGENRILFNAGANAQVSPADVQLSGEDSIVVFQHELSKETVVQGVKKAVAAGKETILNPAPAFPLPDDTYHGLSHLIMNESEAAFLSGTPDDQLLERIDAVAAHFLHKGVGNVIITLGARGLYWRNTEDSGTLSAPKVKAVDTTAAGDTFVGAFAAHLAEHGRAAVQGALDFATRAAALSVQKEGAQASIPSFEHVLPR